MKTRLLSGILLAAPLFAANKEVVRHVTIGSDDIITLSTATREYSSVVLDENEKALSYLCGDPKFWDIEIIQGAERFLMVKPSKAGIATDIQILTDHGHNYTVKASEVTGTVADVDLKLFVEPYDQDSLKKAPTAVPAAEADKLKADLKAAQDQLAEQQKKTEAIAEGNKTALKQQADALQANVLHSLHFDYLFEYDKAPFHILSAWNDGKFSYIKARPEEVASAYEVKDGKLNLVQMDYYEGVYTIRRVIDGCVLQVGKKKTEITKKPGV